jgi:uridine kinase
MIGDKLIIEPYHTARAEDLCGILVDRITPKYTISIAGESGAGKSELAYEISRLLREKGITTDILQQDDYFVFPPKTNHEMRRRNIEQVGLFEVKLDFLDSNLRSFKRGESPIYKPLVIFDEDRITTEEKDLSSVEVLIAEGTYTSVLKFIDFHIFIDQNYVQTLETRKRRARDKFDDFMLNVLKKEHKIISYHKQFANAIITPDFEDIILIVP